MKNTYETNVNLEKAVDEIIGILAKYKITISELEPVLNDVKSEIYHNTSVQIPEDN